VPSLRLSLAALLLTTAPAAAQQLTSEQTAKVDRIVADALASSQVPSASIAIVRDGKIVYAKAYGDQGPGMARTSADAKYPIASISKQFTAAALLSLEDEGKLSLDDKVAKFFPDVSGADKISIRQLLSHTAGLQDYWPQDYSFAAMEKPTTPQAIVDRWGKKPLDFEPGTAWQYSNTGYVVAGMIAEKAAGVPLLTYLERKIFKPLGMTPVDQDLAIGKGYPLPTHRSALGPVRPARPAAAGWLWAAGELAMSASDLAKWDIARINRSVLPADDWQAQETPTILADGKNSNYGLGVFAANRNGRIVVEHGGEAVGFLSENIVIPSEKFAVVALVNADFGGAQGTIAEEIQDLLAPAPATAAAAAAPVDDESFRADLARSTYAALQHGQLDRSKLTVNASYYFTPEVVGDYRDSLGPLGAPTSITPIRTPRLRGGFVNRNYMITYPDRKLVLVTYAEAGREGKFEQFIVMPAD
jgi:D-alanyl-D-alanine carboxypeptidase